MSPLEQPATERLADIGDEFRWLGEAGFAALPLPSSTGHDDGILFWRTRPSYIDTVAVWGPEYAVGLRVPSTRDWSRPFMPSRPMYRKVGRFHEVVHGILSLRLQAPAEPEVSEVHDDGDEP